MTDLPESVQEIADVIGRDAALRLVGSLQPAGARSWRRSLYVPQRLKPGHPLVDLVGIEDARKLVDHFAGSVLQPGACAEIVRDWNARAMVRLARDGWTAEELADAFALSVRQVRNVVGPDATTRRRRDRRSSR